MKIWEFRTFLKVSDGAEGTPWVPEAPKCIKYNACITKYINYTQIYIINKN